MKSHTNRRVRRTKAVARLVRRALRHSTSTWRTITENPFGLTPLAA